MLNQFASSLTACIIVITIIEMLLPNGKNKKYVTFVSSMLLIIIIINPIITLFNKNLNLDDILKNEEKILATNEYASKMEYAKEKSIKETYQKVLKEDIITRLEENGYIVKNVSVVIDEDTYNPIQMELQIEHDDGDIEKVVIDVSSNQSENIDDLKVKEILNNAYGIKEENVFIGR